MTATRDTAATALARFDHAWATLDKTVQGLSERELTEDRGDVGRVGVLEHPFVARVHPTLDEGFRGFEQTFGVVHRRAGRIVRVTALCERGKATRDVSGASWRPPFPPA